MNYNQNGVIQYDEQDFIARQWLLKHSDYISHAAGDPYGPTKSSYSSPYYDYQKAHDYYEQHKVLKGRTRSKSMLSDEGKQIYEVAQYNIKQAKEKENENVKTTTQGQIDNIQNAIARLKTMASDQRGKYKEAINARIQTLKEQLAVKKEQFKSELEKKRTDIKNDNTRETEKTKTKKERYSKGAQNEIERKQEKIKSLGNSESEKLQKARIRQDIAGIREDKALKNTEFSNYLKKYKESNATELTNYRASNAAGVKSATDSINSSIKKIREDLKSYNTDSRSRQKGANDEFRAKIKELRQASQANRKLINDRYKEIQNQEFDRILAQYPNTKKKK